MSKPLLNTKLPLELIHRGKVRDIYAVDDKHMLIVATDRVSAFDVVFDQAIHKKGAILTTIANFWFDKTAKIIPNHLSDIKLNDVLADKHVAQIQEQAIIVKKLKPLPIEAIVRGYIIGSGWSEYQKTGAISAIKLKQNLRLAEKISTPIYTPSTKANVGAHDVNISFTDTLKLLGEDIANQVKQKSLEIYNFAAKYALERGIIIADTKLEFGLDEDNNLILIDEVLTPDSSRFWSKADYQVGISPKSFDKQIIRDYLESISWNKQAPAPTLPEEICKKTSEKYNQVAKILCN